MKKFIVFLVFIVAALVLGISEASDIEDQQKYSMFGDIPRERTDEALDIIKKVGVKEVKESTHDPLLDHDGLIGYRLRTDLDSVGQVIVYFDNEKLRQVRFLGEYLYINQEIVKKVSDIISLY